MEKTEEDYIEYLNDIYYGEDLTADIKWMYMLDNAESEEEYEQIDAFLVAGKLGDALKLGDPTAFNVGFSEWLAEQEDEEDEEYAEPASNADNGNRFIHGLFQSDNRNRINLIRQVVMHGLAIKVINVPKFL